MENKTIGIGLLGYGVVGYEAACFIRENKKAMEEQYGIKLEIKKIYVRNKNKKRKTAPEDEKLLTEDFMEVTEAEDIDICVECLGGAGTELAYQAVMSALNHEKEIIMSSKKCLARYENKILGEAEARNLRVRFEGTTQGAVPVCRALQGMAKGEEICKIYGIVNATSNYILTEMMEKGKSYEEALAVAREKGYAENDPSDDVDGVDAANKLNILLRLTMKAKTEVSEMKPESIREISMEEIKSAEARGHRICPVIYAEKITEKQIGYYVGPVEVPMNHLISGVKENYNIVLTDSEKSAIRAFYGKGAGGKETASSVYDDVVSLATSSVNKQDFIQCEEKELVLLERNHVFEGML